MEKERVILGLTEDIELFGMERKKRVKARIDTGAESSSMDIGLASELRVGPIVHSKVVKSASGKGIRPVITAKVKLHGKMIRSNFTIAQRSHMKYPVLIGQDVLKKGRYMIDPLIP